MADDARLEAIGRLVDRAGREFGIRPPDALTVEVERRPKWFGLCVKTKKGRWRIRIRAPRWDPLPALTLAHELAHIRHWKHGDEHDILTVEIMDFWQIKCADDLRLIG